MTSRTSEPEPRLAAFYFGLLPQEEHDEVERIVRSDPAIRRRCSAWPTAAAAITGATLVVAPDPAEARLEQRLIQRARLVRPPAVRSHYALRVVRRNVLRMLLVLLVAIAALFGYLAFRAEEPISGRAIALTDDGATGVLLPRYEDQLFALIFWGLPPLNVDETWQIWLVRASGSVEPGPTFGRDAEGRAAVSIDPNVLESEDELIGFVVSRDVPSRRLDGTPSSDDILYQFPRR